MNNTLIKGLQIIELLAHQRDPMTLSEIARRLDFAKSNVHSLLQTLSTCAYVIKDRDSGAYTASIRLWELGSAILSKLDLRRHAEHVMEVLAEETGESVHLSIRDLNEVVYVHKVEGPNPIRAYTQIGGRAPIYCVATGKAMLAFQSRESILSVAQHLKAYSANTIAKQAQLLKELEQVRRQGYAVNMGEWRESVYGVGTSIFDATGQVIAAIGVSGPAERFNAERIHYCADMLREAADSIMAGLGGSRAQHALSTIGRHE